MRKYLLSILLISLILPSFSFAQEVPQLTPPKTLDEAKEIGERAGRKTLELLPGILKNIWRNEVLPIWQKMYDWGKNLWTNYIWPKLGSWLKREVEPRVEEEIEKRKPIIEEEFQKEKEELKEEIKKELPKVKKSLWERFKELLK